LYQGRFKSFPVEQDDHFYALCRYVERNALRASLATRAEDWRWCSLWQHSSNSWPVALDPWPLARPAAWIELVNGVETEAELAAVRNSVRRGSPFGSTLWRRRTAAALGLEKTLHSRGRPSA
jgi:putative transposase